MEKLEAIALHEPEFSQEDIDAVTSTLTSGWVSTGGSYVEKFEKQFASYVDRRFAITMSNGTVALQIALECLKRKYNIKSGFDVIVPNMTFIATANAVVHAGGTPVLADTAENSLNISLDSIQFVLEQGYKRDASGMWKNKSTRNTLLAVMPVHVMGWIGELEKIQSFSKDIGVDVVEDAAESLGTKLPNGKHSGCSGIMSCYSFNGNKILTTGGGGMVATDDKDFANHLKHLSTTAKIDGLRYIHDEVGYNFRMVNILAALGYSQLKRLNLQLEKKHSIFQYYKEAFKGSRRFRLYEEMGYSSNNWLNNLIFESRDLREKAMKKLLDGKVQVRPLWTPISEQPAYNSIGSSQKLKNSIFMWERTLSLPSSAQLKHEQLDTVVNLVKEVVD